jgi:hypothetical protein
MPDPVTDEDLAEFQRLLDGHRRDQTNLQATEAVARWMWNHVPAVVDELLRRRRSEETMAGTLTEVVDKGLELKRVGASLAEALAEMDIDHRSSVKVAKALAKARKMGLLDR